MAEKHVSYKDRISIDPQVMVGKPVVKGTRVPVERVIQHLADKPDFDDVLEAFPHLTIEDIQACLAYARDQLQQRRPRENGPTPRSGRAVS